MPITRARRVSMFCKYCGKESTTIFHHECFPYRKNETLYHPERFCTSCGIVLHRRKNGTNTNAMLCLSCVPSTLPRFAARGRATGLVHNYKDHVHILYECQCLADRKVLHHFDYYNFPLHVIKLCYPCHSAEHKRLRQLAAQAARNSSSLPLDQAVMDGPVTCEATSGGLAG
jgi:hypothetical protein